MKAVQSTSHRWRRPIHWCIVLGLLIVWKNAPSQDVVGPYSPEMWAGAPGASACGAEGSFPDSGGYHHVVFKGDLPSFGYPYHRALVAGINDTLHAIFQWLITENCAPLVLKGTDYEHWYAPCVFMLGVDSGTYPIRDSTELGYRFRGWYRGLKKTRSLDTLSWEVGGRYYTKMDIWNLPEGHYQLCLFPTTKVPSGFVAVPYGNVYEYYPARSLADSVNGYEGCFWRAIDDSDYAAAKKWVDKILAIHPTSVPGWELKAYYSWELGDTAATRKACDFALQYLQQRKDPAMPDSTKRPLSEAEYYYLECVQTALEYHRCFLGP